METLSSCPICSNGNFKPFLQCIDHIVSRETFSIVECEKCGLRFTNPRPAENEIGKYYQSEDYVSHSGTKKGFVNRIYHIVRNYTLAKKLQLLESLTQNRNLLDIGCGTGEFLNTCKQAKWNVIGVEPGEQAREFAKKQYGLDVRQESEIQIFKDNTFDIITMWHVLEHVHNLNDRVGKLKKLLKPNGVIIIAVPNCSSLDARIYKQHWAAYDVPRHLWHFIPRDIKQLFSNQGMKVQKILPMRFDSFYVSMLSEKYPGGFLLRGVWNGLRSNLAAISSGEKFSSQIYVIRKA